MAEPSDKPVLQPSVVISKKVATSAAINKNYKLISPNIIIIESFNEVSFILRNVFFPYSRCIFSKSFDFNPVFWSVWRKFSRDFSYPFSQNSVSDLLKSPLEHLRLSSSKRFASQSGENWFSYFVKVLDPSKAIKSLESVLTI